MSLIERMCIHEIIPGRLWQSGCPVPLCEVKEAGINAIVNVGQDQQQWLKQWRLGIWDTFQPVDQVRQAVYLYVPLMDADGCLDAIACDVAIRGAVHLLSDPRRRVLIHCEAGHYRSVHVTAGVLAAVEGLAPTEAFREADRRALGRGTPRESLGMAGWNEHVATFAPHAPTLDSGHSTPTGDPE